jgi:hypothetical protein
MLNSFHRTETHVELIKKVFRANSENQTIKKFNIVE